MITFTIDALGRHGEFYVSTERDAISVVRDLIKELTGPENSDTACDLYLTVTGDEEREAQS